MTVLHGYWRSSAAYRVRIALNLKGVAYEQVAHDLRTGAQSEAAYRALNSQGLVPALEIDGTVLTQSSAIIEWLEERHPKPPLLPVDPIERAFVRAMAAIVACDIHPLNNLRGLQMLRREYRADEAAIARWTGQWSATASLPSTRSSSGMAAASRSATPPRSPTATSCRSFTRRSVSDWI